MPLPPPQKKWTFPNGDSELKQPKNPLGPLPQRTKQPEAFQTKQRISIPSRSNQKGEVDTCLLERSWVPVSLGLRISWENQGIFVSLSDQWHVWLQKTQQTILRLFFCKKKGRKSKETQKFKRHLYRFEVVFLDFLFQRFPNLTLEASLV